MVSPGEASARQGSGVASSFAALQVLGVSHDRVDTYNRELVKYYNEYKRHLANLDTWQEGVGLHAMIELVVANEGTAPASNIDLELDFPEEVMPVDIDDFPKEPKPPKPPARPHGLMDIPALTDTDHISSLLQRSDLSALINPNLINPNYNGAPVIDHDTSSVCISLSSLKHGFTSTCDPFLIRFRSRQSISNFSIEYRLSADELPEAVTGELHVRINDGEE
jgi:hypothetical protein